ncbi:prenyltransferase/squalene oxidase repeat-containing protein [Actinomadura hibisca]|uniref:prenyltransferase/squalene oxidase repeat-containing protein n=1 Tax=Actinomadura hibisca TaxID=68565 RepID=UPI00082D516F|nr:prenyltransferase/squalene oxidase repeat-containing protein [Actinomadura hibisca]
MRRTVLLAVVTGVAAATLVAPPASAAPQPTAARKGTAGHCPDRNGVTVAVDYQELGGEPEVRCAPGEQATGIDALENAGFVITGTDRWGKHFVCRINGKPGAETEPCVDTPPASAYWSYWHASNGGQWEYSNQGAGYYKPPLGSYEGWSFSKDKGIEDNPKPRVTPLRPGTPTIPPVEQTKPLPEKAAAVASTRWLAGQLDADGGMPGFNGTDWGLTIDALLAMKASRTQPQQVKKTTALLSKRVASYITYDDWGQEGVRVAGATAKMLVAAQAGGANPRKFGGWDLRATTLSLMARSGRDKGRFKDQGTQIDNSNTFGQSFGVIGLARSGGVPAEAVDFLIRQQCKAGGFRLSPDQFGGGTPTAKCDDDPQAVLDPDSTAMAVQALLTGKPSIKARLAALKGAAWLAKIQRKDGSFGGSGPTEASNTNSTGLAGQALRASGLVWQAAKASDYVRRLQLTKRNAGEATDHLGAIAYNTDALREAQLNGIPENQLDQWRRATPQAVLVATHTPLGKL